MQYGTHGHGRDSTYMRYHWPCSVQSHFGVISELAIFPKIHFQSAASSTLIILYFFFNQTFTAVPFDSPHKHCFLKFKFWKI